MSLTSEESAGKPRAFPTPAVNVVIFGDPGPPLEHIEAATVATVDRNSMCRPGGVLGYLVLSCAEFDRVWELVDNGRALESAAIILPQLGNDAAQYVGLIDDFIYGWTGQQRSDYGRTLLLQVIPRPHRVHNSNSRRH